MKMKPIRLIFVLSLLCTGCRPKQSTYLQKALSELERIERAAYRTLGKSDRNITEAIDRLLHEQ